MEIKILENEYWWGGVVDKSIRLPFNDKSDFEMDVRDRYIAMDQSSPLFVSSKGRYIWSEKPFKLTASKGTITCEGESEIKLYDGFGTLKEACKAALKAHWTFDKEIPDELFFKVPQYNTWIELTHDQTHDNVIKYAENIIKNGMPKGILMIDDGWQENIGEWKFHSGKFPNPKETIDKLHEMGFTVMIWVIPTVAPDSENFRQLNSRGLLLKDKDGKVAIREWWAGYSAVLDLTNPEAAEWFHSELDELMEKYGIDGFKFDGGDPYFYMDDDQIYTPMIAHEQTKVYNDFAKPYKFNEFRTSYNNAGAAIVSRLQDKRHSWDEIGVNCIIPNSLMQSFLGYFYHCPDMIGGGDSGAIDRSHLDQELIVRYAQASALMPMMQFSLAPWRVLSEKNFAIVKEAALLHEKYGEKILNLAKNAAQTGEPVIRLMEYEFPGEGFEPVFDQFMLGNDVLVAPVIKSKEYTRTVKLPKGEWISDRGEKYQGGQTITVDAPIERIPYFTKVK